MNAVLLELFARESAGTAELFARISAVLVESNSQTTSPNSKNDGQFMPFFFCFFFKCQRRSVLEQLLFCPHFPTTLPLISARVLEISFVIGSREI